MTQVKTQNHKLIKNAMAQANVVTSAKEDLTRNERRVLYLYLRHNYLNGFPEDGFFLIDHHEYAERFGLSINDARADLRRAVVGFKGKCVHIKKPKGGWIEYDWTNVREEREHGVYAVHFNPALRPFLDVFSDPESLPYTLLSLDYASNLKTKWGQRLYNSLCQWRTTGEFRIKLSELIDVWTIPDGYKGRWQDIRRYIIEPAVADVQQNTDLKTLTYVTKREGARRAVTALLFQFDTILEE